MYTTMYKEKYSNAMLGLPCMKEKSLNAMLCRKSL